MAIDQAFDKLERQIRRVHDKRSRRHAPGQATIRDGVAEPETAPAVDDVELDEERDEVGELVRTKRFGMKPMDVDEAIEQMELLGHDFFLFHYVDEDIPSVVYRRRDGAYGLLIPERRVGPQSGRASAPCVRERSAARQLVPIARREP